MKEVENLNFINFVIPGKLGTKAIEDSQKIKYCQIPLVKSLLLMPQLILRLGLEILQVDLYAVQVRSFGSAWKCFY